MHRDAGWLSLSPCGSRDELRLPGFLASTFPHRVLAGPKSLEGSNCINYALIKTELKPFSHIKEIILVTVLPNAFLQEFGNAVGFNANNSLSAQSFLREFRINSLISHLFLSNKHP